MVNVLMLLGMAAFFAGLVGIFRPSWVGLASRWQAGFLLFASTVPATAVGEFYPSSEAHQEPGATLFIVLWVAGLSALTIFVRVALRANALSKGAFLIPTDGNVEKMAQKWAAAIAILHAEGKAVPVGKPKETENSAQSVDIDARRQIGAAFIAKLAAKPKRAIAPIFTKPVSIGCDDYYSGSDDGEWGRILKRGDVSTTLCFEYVNQQGEITIRTLHKWVEYPQYLQGWCEDACDTRTFRKDRVNEWIVGREDLRAPKGRSRL